jgi:hypothetical protein
LLRFRVFRVFRGSTYEIHGTSVSSVDESASGVNSELANEGWEGQAVRRASRSRP